MRGREGWGTTPVGRNQPPNMAALAAASASVLTGLELLIRWFTSEGHRPPPPAPSLTLFLPPRPNVKWQESLWGQENRLRGVVNIFLGFWNVDEGLPSFNNWTPPGWKPERCGFKC